MAGVGLGDLGSGKGREAGTALEIVLQPGLGFGVEEGVE